MQPGHDPRVASLEAREYAQKEFDAFVIPRRLNAGIEVTGDGAWGLALSGGGIRSATFCIGLVRGLAKGGLLKRFDYLSTVSGGGYLGASLGRLYGDTANAARVEQGIAKHDSMWLWWLRNNGRYLTPAGAKDLGYATASIVRGVIATNLEIGILVVLMASLVLLPHLLVALFPPFHDSTPWNYALVSSMPSIWGWLLVLPAYACIHQVCAYWYTRETQSGASIALIALAAVCFGALAWKSMDAALLSNSAAKGVLAVLAIAPVTALLASIAGHLKKSSAASMRLLRTKRLSYGLWALGIVLALLLLDWCSWQLTRMYWDGNLSRAKYNIGATIIALAAIGRLALPQLQRWMGTTKGPSINLERTLNLVGLALGILIAVMWTTLLSIWLFPESDRTVYWSTDWSSLRHIHPVRIFALVFATCAAYILATRRSFDLLNLASLHNFYRARIERAYVSSGNDGAPGSRFPESALASVNPSLTMRVAPLTEAIPGDDAEMWRYCPHEHGGPIHLVNCCINQSVDDRTGLYNADRKGVALAVSSLGVEVGTNFPERDRAGSIGTLSQWIAISGAAASTGMGSRTSPGFAALLFMSGIRLGHWTSSLLGKGSETTTHPSQSAWLRWAPKPFAIVAESLARFPGLFSPLWYVSDGGHFDNTGIYALLKRRPRVIVAADCGADPKYLFSDIESLVRKAKIDYGAAIEFISPAAGSGSSQLQDVLGTPETIGPELGNRWLLLGRIVYSDGSEGTLLVVKPRRLDAMPFDMVAYADRNPDYPQQTTGDQFFDESQWESYHQLGLLMGSRITPELVTQAQQAVTDLVRADSSLAQAERAQVRADIAKQKADRGKRASFTVRATLGAGLSLSVVVAAWQGFEQVRESRDAELRQYIARSLALSEKIRDTPADALLEEQFVAMAQESMERGDKRFETILQRLNVRCESLPDGSEKTSCVGLYSRLIPLARSQPEPFYDYWFSDKRNDYRASLIPQANAAPSINVTATHVTPSQAISTANAPSTSPPGNATIPDDRSSIAGTPRITATLASPCARGVRLYVHIYDEESRIVATTLGNVLMQALGATEAPVENVVTTARRKGQATPYIWTKPTLVFPATSDRLCLDLAQRHVVGGLGTQMIRTGIANHLELWIPPRTVEYIETR